MADGILAAVNENGNIDRFIDTKGGVHYIEPKRYEESVAKIDAAATKAKETVNSATEAVSECKAQTGACAQETARAKEIADTVESRITGIEGDIATLRDSVSQVNKLYNSSTWHIAVMSGFIYAYALDVITGNGTWDMSTCPYTLPEEYRPSMDITAPAVTEEGGSCTGYISVSTTGKITVGNNGGKGSANKRRGIVMYPIGM